MKYFFYSLICCALLASCESNSKSSKTKDTINKSASIGSGNPLFDEFIPIIQGSWVCKDYIDEIAKTKSPYKAREKLANISTFLVNTKFFNKDTLRIEVGYGNHEGGELMLKFQPGKSKGTIRIYSPGGDAESNTLELGYNITRNDTTLFIYTFDKTGKITDTTKYFRVFKNFEGHELGYSTYYMVDKVLISGTYLMTDTLNNTSKVEFDDFGKVTGFLKFTNYDIDIDFTTPPGNNMDQINFDISTKDDQLYAYKFDHDTLNLYKTSMDKDSIDLILGKRIYKLVKQK